MELGDGSGCPAVHEMQRGLVAAGHRREQAGGPGRGHRGSQASRCFDGRPQLLSQVSLIAGVLLCGQPGVLQRDLAAVRAFDRLCDGLLDTADTGLALRVGRPLDGLTDLEDQGGVIDRDPVDRRPDHQGSAAAAWHDSRSSSPDSTTSSTDSVTASARLASRSRPGWASQAAGSSMPRARSRSSIRIGDVIESGLPAAQQGIEVFQGAGVAADVAVGPVPVGGGQGIQAGQPPHQLAGLGRRQRAQVKISQPPLGRPGQRERVPAGENEPALPGPARPAGQEGGQLGIADLPAAAVGGVQVVLEVVQQHRHRQHRQDLLGQQPPPVGPFHVGGPQMQPSLGQTLRRPQPAGRRLVQARPDLAEHVVDRHLPGLGDHQAGVIAEGPQHLGGQGGLAHPADAVQHQARLLPAQRAARLPHLPPPADELAHLADDDSLGQHRGLRRVHLAELLTAVEQRQPQPPRGQRRGGPLRRAPQRRARRQGLPVPLGRPAGLRQRQQRVRGGIGGQAAVEPGASACVA